MTRKLQKVIDFHIDGFNLYHGLRTAFEKKDIYNWVDLVGLCNTLKPKNSIINSIIYYTALIQNHHEFGTTEHEEREHSRIYQEIYLNALLAHGNLEIKYGIFKPTKITCFQCNHKRVQYSEKKTDVQIAIGMVHSTFNEKVTSVALVSADSDLTPAVDVVRERGKEAIVYFPPRRRSSDLRKRVNFYDPIRPSAISKNQLPETIISKDGDKIERPKAWR